MRLAASVLVLAAVIIGVVAGYGISYLVYQPKLSQAEAQLQEISSALEEIESMLPDLENEFWGIVPGVLVPIPDPSDGTKSVPTDRFYMTGSPDPNHDFKGIDSFSPVTTTTFGLML